ncbi:polysaccharide biosynthesis protein [Marinobacter caseinilyticus]|uniref:polysaccharide biosynthesis protein n=1 Tax=Marinobacter caseinilyticus TaxID=2692195 RepID=UPI00140CDDAA|nr:polysaccharide biosynthesis protein [Marinobacter caseinilyticus]
MDESKLYNALLKSQEERRQQALKEGEASPDNNFRTERPYAGSTSARSEWAGIISGHAELPPTLYDASVSLAQIENPRPWSREQLRERKILYPGMPNKAIMDAYREIRIKLRDQASDKRFTVMLSSLGGNMASTLTAYNLAASFALDAQTSALLIDCDPYDKELPNLVSTPMDYGVTDFVSDPSLSVKQILYPSGVDRLSIIPAGTQASSAVELFSATRMKDLMTELRGRYPDRCIVINAPPFRDSTEARILVRYADQVVFGVPFGQVNGEEIMDCVDALGLDKFSGLIFQE